MKACAMAIFAITACGINNEDLPVEQSIIEILRNEANDFNTVYINYDAHRCKNIYGISQVCEVCYSKIKSTYEKMKMNREIKYTDSNRAERLVEYIKAISVNHDVYGFAKNQEHQSAINTLFKSPMQEAPISVIYNMFFNKERDMKLFKNNVYNKIVEDIGDACKGALTVFEETYNAIYHGIKDEKYSLIVDKKLCIRSIDYFEYNTKYSLFVKKMRSSTYIVDFFKDNIDCAKMADGDAKFSVKNHFYNIAMQKIVRSNLINEKSTIKIINSYITNHANCMTCENIHYFQNYKVNALVSEMFRDTLIRTTISNSAMVEEESIYNLFRLYSSLDKLCFPVFVEFIALVSNKIWKMPECIAPVLQDLHNQLILEVFKRQETCQPYFENIECLYKACENIEGPQAFIKEVEHAYINFIMKDSTKIHRMLVIIREFCTSGKFAVFENFLATNYRFFNSEFVVEIMLQISKDENIDFSNKTAILYVFFKVGILNEVSHEYLKENQRLMAMYLLGLAAYIYKYYNERAFPFIVLMDTFKKMYADHSKFFRYDEENPELFEITEYYALNGYIIILNGNFEDALRDYSWKSTVLPKYTKEFYQKLFEIMNGIKNIHSNNPCLAGLFNILNFLYCYFRK